MNNTYVYIVDKTSPGLVPTLEEKKSQKKKKKKKKSNALEMVGR